MIPPGYGDLLLDSHVFNEISEAIRNPWDRIIGGSPFLPTKLYQLYLRLLFSSLTSCAHHRIQRHMKHRRATIHRLGVVGNPLPANSSHTLRHSLYCFKQRRHGMRSPEASLPNTASYIPDGISIASSTSKILTFVTAGCFGFPSAPEPRHTPDGHGRGRRRHRERLSAPLDCYYLILCKELLTTTCV
ncbi:hypothetical protein V496_09296 [Pseudogymnoascus sp. VKM F-4515 (FW-2607)]|nr:hypothetical protein V496_09296 [Pseudogymnoascus sp. VKM F-4515 (FW-2607)]